MSWRPVAVLTYIYQHISRGVPWIRYGAGELHERHAVAIKCQHANLDTVSSSLYLLQYYNCRIHKKLKTTKVQLCDIITTACDCEPFQGHTGVDSASNTNQYQEYFLGGGGVKAAGA
jgi:hypothetical protein